MPEREVKPHSFPARCFSIRSWPFGNWNCRWSTSWASHPAGVLRMTETVWVWNRAAGLRARFQRLPGGVFWPRTIWRGDKGVTYDLPIDYSSDFDGPRQGPSDDIIEFLLEIGWPEDSPRTKEVARKPFVSFSNQSFSLATTEAGTPTLKLTGPRRTVTVGNQCAAHRLRWSEG
jgi:hypothetical protein